MLTYTSYKEHCDLYTEVAEIEMAQLLLITAYRNSWSLDARVGRWTLDAGRWTLDARVWTLDSGRWTPDAGLWTRDAGLWTLDAESWTLNSRRWTPGIER